MIETGYDWANEELHPLSMSLEDQLILEEDEVESGWSEIALLFEEAADGMDAVESETAEVSGFDSLFT